MSMVGKDVRLVRAVTRAQVEVVDEPRGGVVAHTCEPAQRPDLVDVAVLRRDVDRVPVVREEVTAVGSAAHRLVVLAARGAAEDRRGAELVPVGLGGEADGTAHARVAAIVEPELLVREVLRLRAERAFVARRVRQREPRGRRQLAVALVEPLAPHQPVWKYFSASRVWSSSSPVTSTWKPHATSCRWAVFTENAGSGGLGAGPAWVAMPRSWSAVKSPEYQPETFTSGSPFSDAASRAPS